MIEESASFLVVDDDDTFRGRLARALRTRGYQVSEAVSSDEALRLTTELNPSHVVMDLRMPGDSGLTALREIKKVRDKTKVLILTGYGSIATALEAVKEGAVGYLSKPTNLDRILAAFLELPATALTATLQTASVPTPDAEPVPSLTRVEWEHINRVLHDCDQNISKAAKLLGLHRRSLQRKLKNPPRT